MRLRRDSVRFKIFCDDSLSTGHSGGSTKKRKLSNGALQDGNIFTEVSEFRAQRAVGLADFLYDVLYI